MYKSKLIKLADFKGMEVELDTLGTPMNEEKIQGILNKLAKGKVSISHVDIIEKGDVVTLDLTSDEGKFNKRNLPVTVGIGLFNSELENQIIGMRKDESQTLNIKGNDVIVEVKSVKRRIIPEITNELIMDIGIEGVTTVEEYRDYLINEDLKQQRMEILPQKSLEYVINNSQYIISEDDIESVYEEEIKGLEAQAELDDITTEVYVKEVYGITLEEFTKWIRENLPMTIKHMLIGMEYTKQNNLEFTEDIYEAELRQYAEGNDIEVDKARNISSYKLHHTRWYPMKANEIIIGYWKKELNA